MGWCPKQGMYNYKSSRKNIKSVLICDVLISLLVNVKSFHIFQQRAFPSAALLVQRYLVGPNANILSKIPLDSASHQYLTYQSKGSREPNSAAGEEDSAAKLHSLTDLTKHLDNLLEKTGPTKHQIGSNNPVLRSTEESVPVNGCYEVVIVLGKPLQNEQVTVEYAARIRELVNRLKHSQRPQLICFCGGRSKNNLVPDAKAGFSFFKTMCQAQGVSLEGTELFIESQHKNLLASMNDILAEVTKRKAKATDLASLHVNLLSQEYNLYQLDQIHTQTTTQSCLRLISDAGGSYSFTHASYPYVFAREEATAFLAKTYLLVEELVPFATHLKGVGLGQTFFLRENFKNLLQVRRQLNEQVAILHTSASPPHLWTTHQALRMNKLTFDPKMLSQIEDAESSGFRWIPSTLQNDSYLIDECLEAGTVVLSQISNLLRPVVNLEASISLADWKWAADLLERAITEMRKACDPDRPLTPNEWMALVTGTSEFDKVTVGRKRAATAKKANEHTNVKASKVHNWK